VQHEVAGVVESVKAAADVFTPVAGEIVAVNEQVRDNPALANTDPQGDGWFFKMKLVHQEELDTLMDEGTYVMFLQNT
jgi:glycine cleavage system H protein